MNDSSTLIIVDGDRNNLEFAVNELQACLERSHPMLAEIKGLNEECGVFGVWGHQDAAQLPITDCIACSIAARKAQALS